MTSQKSGNKPVYLSKDGLKKVKQELQSLIEVKREEVAEKIAEAKSYGDLSENAEYEQAKEQQAFVEGRILELQSLIKHAQIIEGSKSKGFIALGSTVKAEFDGEKVSYSIVGSTEANPLEGKISNESPIGSALLGKKKGETFTTSTPRGEMTIKILSIS